MKKLSNTEAEFKKALLIKNRVFHLSHLFKLHDGSIYAEDKTLKIDSTRSQS